MVLAAVLALNISTGPPASGSEARRSSNSDPVPVTASDRSIEHNPNTDPEPSEISTSSAPKPSSSALNSPGEDFDFSSYLRNGRVSIAYFYADWCPACRELSPVLARINRDDPNTQVLFLDIGDWNTPIADRYRVNSVPFLRIYDKKGFFIAEGEEATNWLLREFRPRS
ncbi:MAG TPA: thioredoxin family protein [Pyrinomonadaceae bacterium]|nr:thioredoxin family protein [Pyrinomonadaceae bacterium]